MSVSVLLTDAALVARLRTYARHHAISLPEAATRLLTAGLDHLDARSRGANAINSRLTAEERSASARRAVAAREAKRRIAPGDTR